MYLKTKILVSLSIVVLLLSSGCGSAQPLVSKSEIFSHTSNVEKLNRGLESAQNNKVDFYSPTEFEKARISYTESYSLGENKNYAQSDKTAKEGLKQLATAIANSYRTKEAMSEVVEYRNLAIDAKANILFPERFDEIDLKLKEVTTLVEIGEIEKAKDYRSELLQEYSSIQLESLQKGIIEVAKQSSKQAIEDGAQSYAPKTLAFADRELKLAVSTLKADRNKIKEANAHAELADYTYRKASRITKIIKNFDDIDYEEEDKILWFWTQLEKIYKPTGEKLNLADKSHVVTSTMQATVSSLVKSLSDSKSLNTKQTTKYQQLTESKDAQLIAIKIEQDAQLSAMIEKQAEKDRIKREESARQKEKDDKYKYVNSLFTQEEANVYRKGEDIIISSTGFSFAVGSAELQSSNFPLIKKILLAIQKFPNSKVEIHGHTDSLGSASTNQKISEKRAENVKSFLVNIGKIDPSIIKSEGYGESKPVVSNMLKSGRAKNRRIDVLIINK